jgi:hypothetical protein
MTAWLVELRSRLLLPADSAAQLQAGPQAVELRCPIESEYLPRHGSAINCDEAARLRLDVWCLPSTSEDWKWVRLFRCIYEHDARPQGLTKIFEGRSLSNGERQA